MNIPAEVKVVLGSTTMRFGEIAKLGPGATVGLDQSIGEPLDLMVNGHLIARGEGVVVDDGATPRFGISITEIRGLLITPIR